MSHADLRGRDDDPERDVAGSLREPNRLPGRGLSWFASPNLMRPAVRVLTKRKADSKWNNRIAVHNDRRDGISFLWSSSANSVSTR